MKLDKITKKLIKQIYYIQIKMYKDARWFSNQQLQIGNEIATFDLNPSYLTIHYKNVYLLFMKDDPFLSPPTVRIDGEYVEHFSIDFLNKNDRYFPFYIPFFRKKLNNILKENNVPFNLILRKLIYKII